MGEHVALFDKNTYGYPGSKDGRIPVPDGGGMLDVTATFGFLAAATTKVRLRHRRRPRAAAQSDLHRQGDVHARLAERRPHRFRHRRRLEQGRGRGLRLSLGRSRRALRRVPRSHAPAVDRAGGRLHGQVGEVRDLRLDPKPIQKPHVPIIVGGYADAAFRRAVRFGAGWYGFNLDPARTKADAREARRRVRQGRPQARQGLRDHHHAAHDDGARRDEGICRAGRRPPGGESRQPAAREGRPAPARDRAGW